MPSQILINGQKTKVVEGSWWFTTIPFLDLPGSDTVYCQVETPKASEEIEDEISRSAISVVVWKEKRPYAHALICITKGSVTHIISDSGTNFSMSSFPGTITLKPGDSLKLNVSLGYKGNPLIAGMLTFEMTESGLEVFWTY